MPVSFETSNRSGDVPQFYSPAGSRMQVTHNLFYFSIFFVGPFSRIINPSPRHPYSSCGKTHKIHAIDFNRELRCNTTAASAEDRRIGTASQYLALPLPHFSLCFCSSCRTPCSLLWSLNATPMPMTCTSPTTGCLQSLELHLKMASVSAGTWQRCLSVPFRSRSRTIAQIVTKYFLPRSDF